MKENQIVDIDGFVHVVNGKVICFTPDVLDVSKVEDRKELLNLASMLFVSKLYPAISGKNTMAVLRPEVEPGCYNTSIGDIRKLPENIQQKARCLVDEFNGRARD